MILIMIGFVETISWAFGWCYFLAWIMSMYPQVIVNWRRKSVVGLNFDYVSLCLVGYAAYAVFNVCFTWVPLFRESYEHLHPHSNIPVQINDVLFSLHGVAATTVLAIQCCIYERGDQHISKRVQAILLAVYSPAIVLTIMLICSQLMPLSYIYFFSYVKMSLTVAKYVPQVIFNYRRKSTQGWSIHNILLDLTGGMLSIGQTTCLAINFSKRNILSSPTLLDLCFRSIVTMSFFLILDDANYFLGNIAKLGIGMTTLVFGSIFVVQHYWLYSNRHSYQDEERSSQGSGESNDSEAQLTVITNHYRPSIKSHHHHLQLSAACNGCCMCINKNVNQSVATCTNAASTSIGRALTAQFPRQPTDYKTSCPLSLAQQLQLKVDQKPVHSSQAS